jgi:hypothetical protein
MGMIRNTFDKSPEGVLVGVSRQRRGDGGLAGRRFSVVRTATSTRSAKKTFTSS